MSKLPTIPPSPRSDLAVGLARLRVTTGKPERRVMHRVCSLQSKPFTVTWERFDSREKFKITAIEPVEETVGKGSSTGKRSPTAEVFSTDEFDSTGLRCAWCSDQSGSVYHPTCNTTYCGGMKLQSSGGKKEFLCPACNEMFETVGTDTLVGQSGASSRSAPGPLSPKAIEGKKQSVLPRWRK